VKLFHTQISDQRVRSIHCLLPISSNLSVLVVAQFETEKSLDCHCFPCASITSRFPWRMALRSYIFHDDIISLLEVVVYISLRMPSTFSYIRRTILYVFIQPCRYHTLVVIGVNMLDLLRVSVIVGALNTSQSTPKMALSFVAHIELSIILTTCAHVRSSCATAHLLEMWAHQHRTCAGRRSGYR